MKRLARHYDKLTAAERAALTIEALARKDIREADHLADSCPEFNYRGRDIGYSLRLSETHRLALLYQIEVLSLAKRAMAAMAVFLQLTGSDPLRADTVLNTYHQLLAQIRAWHDAWGSLCEKIAVPPAPTLAAFGIHFDALERGERFIGGDEDVTDTVTEAEALDSLWELWKCALERAGV